MRSDLMSGTRPSEGEARGKAPTGAAGPKGRGAADAVEPLFVHFFGGAPPVRFEFWDGTSLGPSSGDVLEVRSPDAVRRLLWAPGELGLARAFVEGDFSFRGDIFEMLALLHGAAPGERAHRYPVCRSRRRGRPTAWAHSAGHFPPLRRRPRPGAGCTPRRGTRRRCVITTTSATTSMPWSSAPA